MPPRIAVTQRVPEPALELLRAHGHVNVNPDPDRVLSQDELIDVVRSHEYVLAQLTNKFDRTVLAANPNLVIVADMAVGFDNIDVEAATAYGVMATNTPGVLTETTADLAWALLLGIARRIVESDRLVREGRWTGWGPMHMLGADVHGKTLGIVGCGRIGQAVARRASGFNMRVLYNNRKPLPHELEQELGLVYTPLDDLVAAADFVSIHTPLTLETRHMFDEERLRRMKPTAYLINTARGPIVDEGALARVLAEGAIAGAGLDVFEREPEVDARLLELPNVIVVPHIGSATLETRTKMAMIAAENIVAAIRGERPPNLLNPEVYAERQRQRDGR